jgi:hypothetical protein
MTYYLFSPDHDELIPRMKRPNGEEIPERTVRSGDRALYKAQGTSKLYRSSYPIPYSKEMKLYTCKTIKHILFVRKKLYEYCCEWFDVYNENGKVEIPSD